MFLISKSKLQFLEDPKVNKENIVSGLTILVGTILILWGFGIL